MQPVMRFMVVPNIITDRIRDWLLMEISTSSESWITIDNEIAKKSDMIPRLFKFRFGQTSQKPVTKPTELTEHDEPLETEEELVRKLLHHEPVDGSFLGKMEEKWELVKMDLRREDFWHHQDTNQLSSYITSGMIKSRISDDKEVAIPTDVVAKALAHQTINSSTVGGRHKPSTLSPEELIRFNWIPDFPEDFLNIFSEREDMIQTAVTYAIEGPTSAPEYNLTVTKSKQD